MKNYHDKIRKLYKDLMMLEANFDCWFLILSGVPMRLNMKRLH